MHLIDINIMNLSSNSPRIKDFINLWSLCTQKEHNVETRVINGRRYYFPEKAHFCDFDALPSKKETNGMDIEISPIICTASGNNYALVKCYGDNYVLDRLTSITALLLGLQESFKDPKILEETFDSEYSLCLIVFNGSSSN